MDRIPVVEVDNLSFSYGDEAVLSDINLTINSGDYLGIIGPNGGGKTTLLKLILRLIKPSKGNIKIFGKNIDQFDDWSKIGYVPQKATAFDPNFPATVWEVVSMGRFSKIGLLKWPARTDNKKVREALEHVEMLDYQNRLIGELSGGQQQRVLIARSLAGEPEIIFMDEPTTGIDIKTQENFYALLTKLNKSMGITLAVVSHDIDVVAHEVSKLACINRTLVYDGSPKEFIKQDYLENLYGKEVKFILHNHQH